MVPLKHCWNCKRDLPLPSFAKQQTRCRECYHDYYIANCERRKMQVRAYRLANPDKVALYSEKVRSSPDLLNRRNKRQRDYNAAHPEKKAAKDQKYYLANKDRVNARKRQWYRLNRTEQDARVRRWLKSNPARIAAIKARDKMKRKTRIIQAGGHFTTQQFLWRWEMYGGLCWMCHSPANSIDHVIAIARGGTNWPSNLRPACSSCNSLKRDQDWRGFVNRCRPLRRGLATA